MTVSEASNEPGAGRAAGLNQALGRWPGWALPAGIAAVALVLRLWVLAQQQADNPLLRVAILDDDVYLRAARAFRSGKAGGESWFLAPLYPWLLARVPGAISLAAASGLSIACGTLSAAVLTAAARALHSPLAGLVAGLLYALAGTFVFHDVLPGQEPVLVLLHAAGFWAALHWCRTGAPWCGGLVGLLVGVAMLGRATSLALAGGAVLVALLRVRPRGRLLAGLGLLAVGLGAALVPAAIRNQRVVGDFTPFPWSGGSNLYISWGPESRRDLTYADATVGLDPVSMRRRVEEIAEEARGRELRPSEVSRYWVERAWREKGTAGEVLAHAFKKTLLFWSIAEFGSNHYSALERRFALWTRFVPVTSWWILALGVGAWLLIRRRRPAADVAIVTLVLAWAALTVFFPVSRYRLPVVALSAALAGGGIAEVLLGRASRGRLRAAGGAVVVLTLVAGSLVWLGSHTPKAAGSVVNVGLAYLQERRAADAERLAAEWIEREPKDGHRDGKLLEFHALTLLEVRPPRPAEALERLGEAEKDARTQWTAGVHAIRALTELGNFQAAEKIASVLIEKGDLPLHKQAEMLANLAVLFARTQRPEEARAALAQALAIERTFSRRIPRVAAVEAWFREAMPR